MSLSSPLMFTIGGFTYALGIVMKSKWFKDNWEIWVIPVVLMSFLLFIQTLHTYQHQYGNAHGKCDKPNRY